MLYGIKPVIIAVVVHALWGLAKTAVKTKLLAAVGIVVLVLSFLHINELVLLAPPDLSLFSWVKAEASPQTPCCRSAFFQLPGPQPFPPRGFFLS
ncbi:MAG: hypothetical protein IPO41_00900 [Acidobacteria bacterium]|nr:hypothetical protein [Acidobacteriota bacterium]